MSHRRRLGLALTLLAAAAPAPALEDSHSDHARHVSSYADQEMTDVASLSRREMDDLEAGAGMGLARPAELNRYPGPKHVLELASELGLGEMQRPEVERVRAAMLAEAQRLGAEIIDRERHLNRRFAHHHIDEESLRQATAEIARLQGELRFVHLRAHLETRAILSPEQIETYVRRRGYESGAEGTPESQPAAHRHPTAAAVTTEPSPAEAPREAEGSTPEESLAHSESTFAAAAERRDRDAFASFMTPATIFATPHGNLRGPAAILEQWAGFFAPGGPSIGWRPERVAVTDDGQVGLSSGPYWIESTGADGATSRFGGTFFSVWRRDAAGDWKIALDSGTEAKPLDGTP